MTWTCEEPGWYVHPALGGICWESDGWYWWPLVGEGMTGPFETFRAAREAAEREGTK